MADTSKSSDGPAITSPEAWDYHNLPDWDKDFYHEEDILAFASALSAPFQELSASEEDLLNPKCQSVEFITALNDWKPVRQTVRQKSGANGKKSRRRRADKPRRGKDETREGWTYVLAKWPLLLCALGWIFFLAVLYMFTRLYIYAYEQYITQRGKRNRLRKGLSEQNSYEDWISAAKGLDEHLGNDSWKENPDYSYYDSHTIDRVKDQMKRLRIAAEAAEGNGTHAAAGERSIDRLRELAEAGVKNNFAGFENPRLYSETYYGTKDLVQDYVDEISASLRFLFSTRQLTTEQKRELSRHLSNNFGRTALCLSGGATFAYYHIGIAKAMLDANLLPDLITGTSGGALVAALLATRTDDELRKLLVPALAYRITACHDPWTTWVRRWWQTGARFDSVEWAKRCSWFCYGSLTFLEAYQRTGRILNVTCVPSDPHTPSILANYLTAPDCVIWSAVLASAAVPGILNPVVLMRKRKDGTLEPYSFGHRWKDGSLRTDVPLKSLNLHFKVNFSIVSQVNPHINLFFFSSRGAVGRPVTHRRGRGWRGGFIGSAAEQYLKLDLNKWLKVLRHLELLPRPMGQDWSEIWLQRFSGTITIWPKSIMSDFWHILADPSMPRLARMIRVGQLAAWPKLKFIANRMAIEKVIEQARHATRPARSDPASSPPPLRNVLSAEDLEQLEHALPPKPSPSRPLRPGPSPLAPSTRPATPSLRRRVSGWFAPRSSAALSRPPSPEALRAATTATAAPSLRLHSRRGSSVMLELKRQSGVFFDDDDDDGGSASASGSGSEDALASDDDDAAAAAALYAARSASAANGMEMRSRAVHPGWRNGTGSGESDG